MSDDERAALVALKDARVRIPKIGGAGAIYERELLSVVDAAIALIEADGKRLAEQDSTLAEYVATMQLVLEQRDDLAKQLGIQPEWSQYDA